MSFILTINTTWKTYLDIDDMFLQAVDSNVLPGAVQRFEVASIFFNLEQRFLRRKEIPILVVNFVFWNILGNFYVLNIAVTRKCLLQKVESKNNIKQVW